MKKVLFLVGIAALALCTSCAKEKSCRCSVIGTQSTRIITIKKGDCSKLNRFTHYDALDTAHVETIVCTDYPFLADSSIVYQK